MEGFTETQVSTLAVRDNLLIAGGFQGELICKVILLCKGITMLVSWNLNNWIKYLFIAVSGSAWCDILYEDNL